MYKLADGSLSTDYKVGDVFEVVDSSYSYFSKGSVILLVHDDDSNCPKFKLINGQCAVLGNEAYSIWQALNPTESNSLKPI